VSKRTKYLLGIGVIAALVFSLQLAVFALPGSNFEITDGNLAVNGPQPGPALDWANVAQTRKADDTPGQTDNAFAEGTKEDDAVPTIGAGGIPPEKSDLTEFGVYFESNAAGDFLNMYWTRVQDPNGTTNMDFEFNQSSTLSANQVTPVRTAGDVLIMYDLSKGGTTPTLWLSKWVTQGTPNQVCEKSNTLPCWGKRTNLTLAGDAAGSINTSAITSSELGPLSARTFGEAQVDFDALTGGGSNCASFGSAYLKSRSSDQFTSTMKDFIAPSTLEIPRCGSVRVIKNSTENAAARLGGAVFQLRRDQAPLNNAGGPGAEDTDEAADLIATCTTPSSGSNQGVCEFNNVLAGEYWVVETTPPSGFNLPTPPYQHVTVTTSTTPVPVTFSDPPQRGALRILKNSTKGGAVTTAGAVFSYQGPGASGGTASITDNSAADGDADIGEICVSNLLTGAYTVNETTPPTGYGAASQSNVSATVSSGTNCSDNQPTGTGVATFTNPPLSDIQVNFRDGGSDETSATISCDNTTGSGSNTAATGWDTSRTVTGVNAPTTVHCTIEIDP
jgi:uncharacterized surface anchored protein